MFGLLFYLLFESKIYRITENKKDLKKQLILRQKNLLRK